VIKAAKANCWFSIKKKKKQTNKKKPTPTTTKNNLALNMCL
jgi:hypothetical protein